jgi:energy-coupling factor transporter ATP-binding protein EcfA2
MEEAMTTAYEELAGFLLDQENRENLEWAIGSAVLEGPKKTVVLFGPPASGKTTFLKIIERLFPGVSVAIATQDADAVEVKNGYTFMAANRAPNFEELRSTPDVILVGMSGRTFGQARYEQLVNEIYETDYELRFIAHDCARRFMAMGSTYFDHVIDDTIPEENDK